MKTTFKVSQWTPKILLEIDDIASIFSGVTMDTENLLEIDNIASIFLGVTMDTEKILLVLLPFFPLLIFS